MKKLLFISLVILSSFFQIIPAAAQPTGYYNGTENKSGEELKSALNDIISGQTVFSYYYAKEIFKLSDADPANPNNIIEIYTGRSWPNDDYGTGGDQLNREHVWSKSHGNFGDVQPMDSDVHNLKPSDASVNVDKSNKDFDAGGVQHPEATECFYTDSTWEPPDFQKGDVARIIFYMDTRYQGENGESDLTVVDHNNTYPLPEYGKLSTLLQWNQMDPPDDFERHRNDVIYSFQHNRNPFIDNPEFAELIWNNATPSTVSIGGIYQDPETAHAGDPVTIHATITSSAGNINDATLSYGTSWGNFIESIDMDGAGDSFYADIPGQSEGTTIYYQIEAQDGTSTTTTVIYNYYVPKTFTGTLTSIHDIQGEADTTSFEGQVLSTTGIVTGSYGSFYFIQNGAGPWNGLYIYDPGRNPSVGDSLILTGTVKEYYQKTEMSSITGYYFISANHPLPEPVTVTCAEAVEPYESVLIHVNNATCINDDYYSDYYMWAVNDGTDTLKIKNTDIFEFVPTNGEAYDITGPLDYDFDEWKIQLRFETDVQSGGDVIPPQIEMSQVVDQNTIFLQFSEDVDQASSENPDNYSINNGITIDSVYQHPFIKKQVFLKTSELFGNSYELTVHGVTDLVGNVMETAVIPFSTTYGINEFSDGSLFKVYPNPVKDVLNIEWFEKAPENVTVSLYGMTGIKAWSATYNVSGNKLISLYMSNFSSGLYLLEVRSNDQVGRKKVMIR